MSSRHKRTSIPPTARAGIADVRAMSIDDQFSKRDEAILTMRAMVFATTMAVRSSLTDEQIEKRRALLDLAQIKP